MFIDLGMGKFMNSKNSLFFLAMVLTTLVVGSRSNVSAAGLDGIVPGNSTPEKITGGHEFDTAGSPLYMNDALYFTNNNFDSPDELSRTYRMNPDGSIDTLEVGNNVTTTLRASGRGTIYACRMLGHRVVELDPDGEVLEVVVDEYDGSRIDGPNDLVVDAKGGLYFSDSQFIAGRETMQPVPSVYYVSPQGDVSRVIDDIEFPNGLALSPDNGTLYVANTQGTHVLAYDVAEDGTVSNGRNFAAVELPEEGGTSGADGMVVDSQGNLYVATTLGVGVQVFNRSGEHLGNIEVPTPSNNVSFGGSDGKTLYISARDGIYAMAVNIEG